MNNDLAHPGSESPITVVKPPKRTFAPFRSRASGKQGALTGPIRLVLSAGGRAWELSTTSYGERLRRIQLTPEEGGAEPEPRVSWAVERLPTAAPGNSYTLEETGVFRTGPISLGPWEYHPEALRFHLSFDGNSEIYGLGEKTGRLERSGRVWEMWNSDDPFHLPSKDPLYVSIPFVIIYLDGTWMGLFLDSSARQYWDTRTPGELSVDVEDEYLDLYLFQGAGPKELLELYGDLTGRPPLPPLWALGYHQSRYSYYPEENVRALADRFRREELPADVIHLDIDYMRGYRVFTWDPDRFPEPRKLIEELRERGFRVITIVDPAVKADEAYAVYREGERRRLFCRHPDGRTYLGRVWPGEAAFPDFSREETRHWWANSHKALFDVGVAGIWNDMNEPADFTGDEEYRPDFTVPNTLIAENDGEPLSFRRFHNLYGSAMSLATRFASTLHRPEERGFVLTRAGYAGIQRLAAIWTGDNHSWWEHLGASIPMLLGMGLSGLPFVGADAGGFQDNASPELFARWIAAAAFTPFYRGHSVCDSEPHEPWSFGEETLAVSRRYLRLRYALLPYIYTAFRAAGETGVPVMRALLLDWPGDPRARRENYEYLFGPAILVAPVFLPDQVKRHVYLPEGVWYDLWTGASLNGGEDHLVPAPLWKLPLFVKGGTIIPREEPRLHTGVPIEEPLSLEIYPDRDGCASGKLYEDAGEGWEYLEGAYLHLRFGYRSGKLEVEVKGEGPTPRWQELLLRLHTVPGPENAADEDLGGDHAGSTADTPFGGEVRELRIPFPTDSRTDVTFR